MEAVASSQIKSLFLLKTVEQRKEGLGTGPRVGRRMEARRKARTRSSHADELLLPLREVLSVPMTEEVRVSFHEKSRISDESGRTHSETTESRDLKTFLLTSSPSASRVAATPVSAVEDERVERFS